MKINMTKQQQPSHTIQKLAHYSWTISLQESLVDQLDIKNIFKKTGARCWVDDTVVNQGCNDLEITGKDEKSVVMAQQIIQRLLRKFRRQNLGAEGKGGSTSARRARSGGDSGEGLSKSIILDDGDTSALRNEEKYASNVENEGDYMDAHAHAHKKRENYNSSESSSYETDKCKKKKAKYVNSKVTSKKGKKHETSLISWNANDDSKSSSDDEQIRSSNRMKKNKKASRLNSFSDSESEFSMLKRKCKKEQESNGDTGGVFPPNGSDRTSDEGITTAYFDDEKEMHSDSDDHDLPDLSSSEESDSAPDFWNCRDNYWVNDYMKDYCIAYTESARIYIDFLKDGTHKTKAKKYLNNAREDWYRDAINATKFMKDIMQEEKQRKEDKDKLWQNQRKAFMDQLSAEVKELKLHEGETDRQFLIFLFGKFPPKHRQEGDWKHLVPEDDADADDCMSMMKRMLELITIYRPDWVDKTFPSSKYHVLCEEIIKELTNRFNRLKC